MSWIVMRFVDVCGKWVITMTFFLMQVTNVNFFQNAQLYNIFEVREHRPFALFNLCGYENYSVFIISDLILLSCRYTWTVSYIIKVLLPTDAQENSFKRSTKIYIKAAPNMFQCNHHHHGMHYMSLVKLQC
jgi:hypothetical protein